MNLAVVQTAGWRVPTDDRQLPPFFYIHKPGGSPKAVLYGGLNATGPVPERVDSPLIRRETANDEDERSYLPYGQTALAFSPALKTRR